ncbi:MAG: hypothetical protein ABI777_04505, partial [Betaproteobacteria bacterium]
RLRRAHCGEGGLQTRLAFERFGNTYRLAEAELPEYLAALVSARMINAVIVIACKPKLTIAPPGVEFDLANPERSIRPTPRQLRQTSPVVHRNDNGARGRGSPQ